MSRLSRTGRQALLILVGCVGFVAPAMALVPGPEPDCMAPCSINPQTGEMDCPCDGVGNVHTPEPASVLLCGVGALGLALRTRNKRQGTSTKH